MKTKLMAGIAMTMIAISACDEDTASVGNSLTSTVDQFEIVADTFGLNSRSIAVDSVLSHSEYSYLGRIKDPETGSYITSDYMTQFTVLEKEGNNIFANKEYVEAANNHEIISDSCVLNLTVDKWQGDSLTPMKLTVYELEKPVADGQYYTNFDPMVKGYIRQDGIRQNKVYTMVDLMQSDSLRTVRASNSSYYDYIDIPLNKEYTDQNGQTYNNYGTYLMRTFYEHPEYYKNSYNFVHKVCPGFYIKVADGVGLMSEISMTQLVVFYHFTMNDSTYTGSKVFNGTKEVLQTTRITNESNSISRLLADNSCTYLKTPAGIYTEVTLPVDDIKRGHENDTIASAKIEFKRLEYTSDYSKDILAIPASLIMVPKDSLYTFFEHNNLPNHITSYVASYNSTYNTYTFNNISGLVNYMYNMKADNADNPNWNKVVLIPAVVNTSTDSYGNSTYTSVANEMDITSVRLVGGSENQHEPLRISVIYNKTSR